MSQLNEYEKELFDFLVQPENFKGMVLVASQLDMVKQQLLTAFWQEFADALKALLPSTDGWVIQLQQSSSIIFDWKIRIYQLDWLYNGRQEVSFGWEMENGRMYYGIIVNKDEPRYEKIYKELTREPAPWNAKLKRKTSSWYPFWEWANTDLSDENAFEQLLPADKKRASLIMNYSELAAELCKEIAPTVNAALDKVRLMDE